jgi:hypothetical protein
VAGRHPEGVQRVVRVHAGGPQEVHGGRPYLADEHAGLQIVALLESSGRLLGSLQREVPGI